MVFAGVAVGVLQRGQIEIAAGIRIGQHQNFIEGNGLQFGLQLRCGHVERNGKFPQLLREGFHFQSPLLILSGECRWVLWQQPLVVEIEACVVDADSKLVEHAQFRQLRVDESGLDDLRDLLVGDAQPPGRVFSPNSAVADALADEEIARTSGA